MQSSISDLGVVSDGENLHGICEHWFSFLGCLLLRLRDRSHFSSLSHFNLSWDVYAGRALEQTAFWSSPTMQIIAGFMPEEKSFLCDSGVAFPGLRSPT